MTKFLDITSPREDTPIDDKSRKITSSTDKKINISRLRNKLSKFEFSKKSTPEKPTRETLTVERVCSSSFLRANS